MTPKTGYLQSGHFTTLQWMSAEPSSLPYAAKDVRRIQKPWMSSMTASSEAKGRPKIGLHLAGLSEESRGFELQL
jgi:hypothetical protein